jgi:hypothetical protein
VHVDPWRPQARRSHHYFGGTRTIPDICGDAK